MKVLSIGNSFSQDAQRYLHAIAKAEGVELKTVNLMIGGCSLRTHYLNVLNGEPNYGFEMNGVQTLIRVTLSQALASDDWDVITLQQASHFSPYYETYDPYIAHIAEYARKYCPKAKIFIHQTWAYESGSAKVQKLGYERSEEMFKDIEASYAKAFELVKADGMIPSGRAMLNASKFGIEKIHRDTFHAGLGAGRYLLGLTWYKALTGNDITNNTFNDFDEPVSDEERQIVIKAVNTAFDETSKKFAGKTFLFLGDSITEGVRGTTSQRKRYTEVFEKLSGAKVYSYGIGGTRIAFQNKPTLSKPRHDMYFASRVFDMHAEADYVVVFGGSNDMANGDAPLGEFGDTTPVTFYGALHDLYTRLQTKYPQAKLVAITPIPRADGDGPINSVGAERLGGMKSYANAIKQVAEAFGVTVLDAYSNWAIDPNVESQREAYFCHDSIHPNDAGHQYMAEKVLEFFETL